MVSNVLAATAILRLHFDRLRSISLLGAVVVLGLIPPALYMLRAELSRYVVLLLVCLYAGRKILQYFKARSALKQLSMENHFLRYGSSGERVLKCVENDEHLWVRSRIVAALKIIAARRMAGDVLLDERRRRTYHRYRSAFRSLMPRMAVLDLGLLVVVAVVIATARTITIDLRAVMFQAGFLSLALGVAAEIAHVVLNRQLQETLERLFNALSEWTIREDFDALYVQRGTYSHQLLYFAQPWFASDSGTDYDASKTSFVTTADVREVIPIFRE